MNAARTSKIKVKKTADALRVDLWVTDADVVSMLTAVVAGRRRDELALARLKIGVLALRQAQGRVDAEASTDGRGKADCQPRRAASHPSRAR